MMRNLIIGIVIFGMGGVSIISGCSQVNATPQYRAEIEKAAILVDELNTRCQNGDQRACEAGLEVANETLQLIVDGMYGETDE